MSRKVWAILLIVLGAVLACVSVYGMIVWGQVMEAAEYMELSEDLLRDALKDPLMTEIIREMLPAGTQSGFVIMLYRMPILIAGIIIAVCGLALACMRGSSASAVRSDTPVRPVSVNNPQNHSSQPDPLTPGAAGAWELVGTEGALAGRSFRLGAQTLIGRGDHCGIIFPQGTRGVSGEHCVVYFDGTQVWVSDARSSFGTCVDGKQIPPGTQVPMHEGQVLQLGSRVECLKLRKV